MTLSIRSVWPLVTPLTILVCALFAAQISANLLEQEFLPDSQQAAPTLVAKDEQTPRATPPRSKSGAALVERNLFCHDCQATAVVKGSVSESDRTQLPLRLIATNIAERERDSFASVLNTSDQRQGGYRVGQEIPGAGIVESIGRDYLSFHNTSTGRFERILFDSGKISMTAPTKAASAGASSSSLAEEYVHAINSTHFEVDRKLVEKLQGNPVLAGARARPVVKDGKMQGVRLFALRSSGLAHAMGLRNGDTLVAANGVQLQSYEAGLELLGQLKTKDHWSVEIQRRGKPLTLNVDLK